MNTSYSEAEAEAFELLHLLLAEFPGQPALAIRHLDTMQQWRVSNARTVLGPMTWRKLLVLLNSSPWRGWMEDYQQVCAAQAEWNAYRTLNDPARLPAEHAGRMMSQIARGELAEALHNARVNRAEKVNARGNMVTAAAMRMRDEVNQAARDEAERALLALKGGKA